MHEHATLEAVRPDAPPTTPTPTPTSRSDRPAAPAEPTTPAVPTAPKPRRKRPSRAKAGPKVENQFGNRSKIISRHQPLLDAFLGFVRLNRTNETAEIYATRLRPLLRAWTDLPPEKWTKLELEAYVGKALKGTLPAQRIPWGTRTTQIFLTACELFGTYLLEHDVAVPRFWESIKKPKSHRKEAKWFTLDEAKRLIEAAKDTRLEMAIPLGINGYRRGEMNRALWSDIDWERKTIVVHGLKTRTDRRIPISPILWDALVANRQEEGHIVRPSLKNNVTRDMQDLCAAARVTCALPCSLSGRVARNVADGVDAVIAQLPQYRKGDGSQNGERSDVSTSLLIADRGSAKELIPGDLRNPRLKVLRDQV